MADRIVEGLWDCPYCSTKAIGGLTKHCPCCGHPQDQGTRFYMGTKINYLDDELAEQYGKGADWICPYCGSLNRIRFSYCANCGSPKEESKADYFGNDPQLAHEEAAEQKNGKVLKKPKKPLWKRLIPLYIIGALIAAMLILFWPHTMKAEITSMEWDRRIAVEAYRTVQESDWDVPSGGRVYDQKQEIHHYDHVVDHYETRTRTVSEEVYDGSDTYTSYSDNGDGTFSETTYETPRYRTEYRTETYSEPIYRDDPVYQIKYYYDIDKWVFDRNEETDGKDCAPYWADFEPADDERIAYRDETYIMCMRTDDDQYSALLPYEMWEKYRAGDQVEITVVAGELTKVDGYELN